ncbi:MAG: hypothetical protein GY821_12780 [Gammaproteobacteria bacterium]|nr:hypothetical protein [Gammaproteobacteria bacterium]
MKTYCTQNNGNCRTCSLINKDDQYDCLLYPINRLEIGDNSKEFDTLLIAGFEALTRIKNNKNIILADIPANKTFIEALETISATKDHRNVIRKKTMLAIHTRKKKR